MLLEDSTLWSTGFEKFGIDIVARASTFPEAITVLHRDDLDVTLADLGIPGMCRYETVAALRDATEAANRSRPPAPGKPARSSPIVAYSVQMTIQTALWCLTSGAIAALSATDPTALFGQVIQRAARGVPTIEPAIAQWALHRQSQLASDPEIAPLADDLRGALETIAAGDVEAPDEDVVAIHRLLGQLFIDEQQRAAVIASARAPDPAATAEALQIRPERISDQLATAYEILFPGPGYGDLSTEARPAARVAAWAKEDHHCPHCPAAAGGALAAGDAIRVPSPA